MAAVVTLTLVIVAIHLSMRGRVQPRTDSIPTPTTQLAGSPPTAEGKLRTAVLSGTVVDLNDRPIQGAQVTIDEVPGMRPLETSSDGVFTFDEVPRGYGEMVRVRVVRQGYRPNPYTEDIILGKAPPRIRLRKDK